MKGLSRSLMFGVAAVITALVLLLVCVSVVSAAMSGAGGHEAIMLHMNSPIGAALLVFFVLAFAAGFAYGSRRSAQAPNH